ncbi:MAG: hypothetical protein MZW92_69245 [Comamonadaceae bacterium]|nr:hypothetical protein [Comamonadaceae bacterium]
MNTLRLKAGDLRAGGAAGLRLRLAVRALAALRQPDAVRACNQGIEYLFMAVVGGAGYVWGALVGAAADRAVEAVAAGHACPR